MNLPSTAFDYTAENFDGKETIERCSMVSDDAATPGQDFGDPAVIEDPEKDAQKPVVQIEATESSELEVVGVPGFSDVRKILKVQLPDDEEDQGPPSGEGSTSALPKLLVPSLRGKMTYEGGSVICKGVWAMSDTAHTIPDQTSGFEFKLIKADDPGMLTRFPIDGTYQGHFYLKMPPPTKSSTKVEDKEIHIVFTPSEDNPDVHTIKGKGVNRFGSFNLSGTLDEDGNIQLYREYYNLTPSAANGTKRRSSFGGGSETPSLKRSKPSQVKIVGAGAGDSSTDLVSPRDGSGRVRKQSSIMKEYEVPRTKSTESVPTPKSAPTPIIPKEPKKEKETKTPVPVDRTSSLDRSHRIKAEMKKSLDVLKIFEKHPQGVWFLEPVDYIKMNIPEYPNIVKHPMDFKTIRKNVESGVIETLDAFAEAMRLVFRNATAFNQLEENVVRIAAKELNARFEERFRALMSQFGVPEPIHIEPMGSKKNPGKQGSKQAPTPRNSLGAAKPLAKTSSAKGRPSLGMAAAAPGPRYAAAPPAMPTVMDGSSHQLLEMQRMMQTMQDEISQLRSQVRENEIMKRLNETKEAAHNPLTFEEKKTLIEQIHKLPTNRMEQVLEIIQSSHAVKQQQGDEEIEVPLDELDTYTLRKLQKFVEDHGQGSGGKKRGAPPRQSDKEAVIKRGKQSHKSPRNKQPTGETHNNNNSSSSSSSSSSSGSSSSDVFAASAPAYDESEELLFEAESFDPLVEEMHGVVNKNPETNEDLGSTFDE